MGKDFPIDVPISSWMMRLRRDINLRVASVSFDAILEAETGMFMRLIYALWADIWDDGEEPSVH